MTIEELRDALSELIENNPESKNQEVRIRYWEDDYSAVRYEGIDIIDTEVPPREEREVLVISGVIP